MPLKPIIGGFGGLSQSDGGGTPGLSRITIYQFSNGTQTIAASQQSEIASIADSTVNSGCGAGVAYKDQFQLGVLSVVIRVGVGLSIQVYNPDIVNSLDVTAVGTAFVIFPT